MDISALSTGRRRRQTYTREFKAKAVGACMQPGVSLAAIAMDLRVSDNCLRSRGRSSLDQTLADSDTSLPQTDFLSSGLRFEGGERGQAVAEPW